MKYWTISMVREVDSPAASVQYHRWNRGKARGRSTPNGINMAIFNSGLSQICRVKAFHASQKARNRWVCTQRRIPGLAVRISRVMVTSPAR